ncbi:MAG: ERCC4 domain-containing protein [Candidatus Aenigmatarchaeota archaeon]
MNRVLIFVDSRERDILEYFKQYDCEVQRKMLLCADFLVSDRTCIERKTVKDFVKSITDKRMFQQLNAMKNNFEKPLLIIEGTETLYGTLQPNAIRGALSAIAIDLGIPIIWTRDITDTAGMVYWIAMREQLLEKRNNVLKNKKVPASMTEKQEYFISSLPDISIVRAKALLKHFKTPQAVLNASEEDLRKVKGIGKKIAKDIRKILEKNYK